MESVTDDTLRPLQSRDRPNRPPPPGTAVQNHPRSHSGTLGHLEDISRLTTAVRSRHRNAASGGTARKQPEDARPRFSHTGHVTPPTPTPHHHRSHVTHTPLLLFAPSGTKLNIEDLKKESLKLFQTQRTLLLETVLNKGLHGGGGVTRSHDTSPGCWRCLRRGEASVIPLSVSRRAMEVGGH